MKRALTGSVLILTAAFSPFGCDDVDVGRLLEAEGGPQIAAIHVQDGSRRGGRFVITDVLLAAEPLLACSHTNPCPAEFGAADIETGAPIVCQFPASEDAKDENDKVGTCPDPMHPLVHPAPVGIDAPGFRNQIRVVFNKQLDNTLDAALQAEGQTIAVLADSSGARVAARTYYDNTGVNLRVAFPFAEPAGPAIVFRPTSTLLAGETYTISLQAAQIKDKDGTAAQAQATYSFTMEALHPYNGIAPDLSASLDTTDVVSLFLNAPANAAPRTSDQAVTRSGAPVFVTAFVNDNCEDGGDVTQVNIARTSSTGEPLEWEEGEYTYDFSNLVAAAGPKGAKVAADALGTALSGTFTVTATTAESDQDIGNFVLPSQCP